jgi:hypothetical protein
LTDRFLANASFLKRSIIACFAEPRLAVQRIELKRLAGNQNGFAAHGAPTGAPMVTEFRSRKKFFFMHPRIS